MMIRTHLLRATTLVVAGASLTACVTSKSFKREMNVTREQIATERAERMRADSVLGADLAGLRAELRKELSDLRSEYDARIAKAENGLQVVMPVTFGFDDAMVRDQDRAGLQRFAEIATKYYPTATITVEGFADPAGTEGYNKRLSQARAENVKQLLAERGLTGATIRAIGMGTTRQVVPGAQKDDPGAERNRRVTFVIESAELRQGTGNVSAAEAAPVQGERVLSDSAAGRNAGVRTDSTSRP